MIDMDPTCNFLKDYLPSKETVDRVLMNHVLNCGSCRDEAPKSFAQLNAA